MLMEEDVKVLAKLLRCQVQQLVKERDDRRRAAEQHSQPVQPVQPALQSSQQQQQQQQQQQAIQQQPPLPSSVW